MDEHSTQTVYIALSCCHNTKWPGGGSSNQVNSDSIWISITASFWCSFWSLQDIRCVLCTCWVFGGGGNSSLSSALPAAVLLSQSWANRPLSELLADPLQTDCIAPGVPYISHRWAKKKQTPSSLCDIVFESFTAGSAVTGHGGTFSCIWLVCLLGYKVMLYVSRLKPCTCDKTSFEYTNFERSRESDVLPVGRGQ